MFENKELKYEYLICRYFIEYYDNSTFVLDVYWDRNAPDADKKRITFILYYVDVSDAALEAMKNFVNDFNNYISTIDQKNIRCHFSNDGATDVFERDDKQFIKDMIEFRLGKNVIKNIKTVNELECIPDLHTAES